MEEVDSPDAYVRQMMLQGGLRPRSSAIASSNPGRIPLWRMKAVLPADASFHAAQIFEAIRSNARAKPSLVPGPAFSLHKLRYSRLFRFSKRSELRDASSKIQAFTQIAENSLGRLRARDLRKVMTLVDRFSESDHSNQDYRDPDFFDQVATAFYPGGWKGVPDKKGLENYAKHQAKRHQAAVEIIKNAQDWSAKSRRAGRHGKGALQVLGELSQYLLENQDIPDPDARIILETKLENEDAVRIIVFRNEQGRYFFNYEVLEENPLPSDHGTRIVVLKKLIGDEQDQRTAYILDHVKVNTRGPILMNDSEAPLNHPGDYDYHNGDPAGQNIQAGVLPVKFWIAANGYMVEDSGKGMDVKAAFEKFLKPQAGDSVSISEVQNEEGTVALFASKELSEVTAAEEWLNGFKLGEKTNKGRPRLNLVKEIMLDFPSGTPATSTWDGVDDLVDDYVLKGIRGMIDILTDPENQTIANRFAKINSLALYIQEKQKLAERKRFRNTDNDLIRYLKKKTEILVAAERENKKIFIPNSYDWKPFEGLENVIPLDSQVFDFDLEDLIKAGHLKRDETGKLQSWVDESAEIAGTPIYLSTFPFAVKMGGKPLSWIRHQGEWILLFDSEIFERQQEKGAELIRGLFAALKEPFVPPEEVYEEDSGEEAVMVAPKGGFSAWIRSPLGMAAGIAVAGLLALGGIFFTKKSSPKMDQEAAKGGTNAPRAELVSSNVPAAQIAGAVTNLSGANFVAGADTHLLSNTNLTAQGTAGSLTNGIVSTNAVNVSTNAVSTSTNLVSIPTVQEIEAKVAEAQTNAFGNAITLTNVPTIANVTWQPPAQDSQQKTNDAEGAVNVKFAAGFSLHSMQSSDVSGVAVNDFVTLPPPQIENGERTMTRYVTGVVKNGRTVYFTQKMFTHFQPDGRWRAPAGGIKRIIPQDAKPTGQVTEIESGGRVLKSAEIDLLNYAAGIIGVGPEDLKVEAVDDQGNVIPGKSVRYQRKGDQITFLEDGNVRITWKVTNFDLNMNFEADFGTLPSNERTDFAAHFGDYFNPFVNSTRAEQHKAIRKFIVDHMDYNKSQRFQHDGRSVSHTVHTWIVNGKRVPMNCDTIADFYAVAALYFNMKVIKVTSPVSETVGDKEYLIEGAIGHAYLIVENDDGTFDRRHQGKWIVVDPTDLLDVVSGPAAVQTGQVQDQTGIQGQPAVSSVTFSSSVPAPVSAASTNQTQTVQQDSAAGPVILPSSPSTNLVSDISTLLQKPETRVTSFDKEGRQTYKGFSGEAGLAAEEAQQKETEALLQAFLKLAELMKAEDGKTNAAPAKAEKFFEDHPWLPLAEKGRIAGKMKTDHGLMNFYQDKESRWLMADAQGDYGYLPGKEHQSPVFIQNIRKIQAGADPHSAYWEITYTDGNIEIATPSPTPLGAPFLEGSPLRLHVQKVHHVIEINGKYFLVVGTKPAAQQNLKLPAHGIYSFDGMVLSKLDSSIVTGGFKEVVNLKQVNDQIYAAFRLEDGSIRIETPAGSFFQAGAKIPPIKDVLRFHSQPEGSVFVEALLEDGRPALLNAKGDFFEGHPRKNEFRSALGIYKDPSTGKIYVHVHTVQGDQLWSAQKVLMHKNEPGDIQAVIPSEENAPYPFYVRASFPTVLSSAAYLFVINPENDVLENISEAPKITWEGKIVPSFAGSNEQVYFAPGEGQHYTLLNHQGIEGYSPYTKDGSYFRENPLWASVQKVERTDFDGEAFYAHVVLKDGSRKILTKTGEMKVNLHEGENPANPRQIIGVVRREGKVFFAMLEASGREAVTLTLVSEGETLKVSNLRVTGYAEGFITGIFEISLMDSRNLEIKRQDKIYRSFGYGYETQRLVVSLDNAVPTEPLVSEMSRIGTYPFASLPGLIRAENVWNGNQWIPGLSKAQAEDFFKHAPTEEENKAIQGAAGILKFGDSRYVVVYVPNKDQPQHYDGFRLVGPSGKILNLKFIFEAEDNLSTYHDFNFHMSDASTVELVRYGFREEDVLVIPLASLQPGDHSVKVSWKKTPRKYFEQETRGLQGGGRSYDFHPLIPKGPVQTYTFDSFTQAGRTNNFMRMGANSAGGISYGFDGNFINYASDVSDTVSVTPLSYFTFTKAGDGSVHLFNADGQEITPWPPEVSKTYEMKASGQWEHGKKLWMAVSFSKEGKPALTYIVDARGQSFFAGHPLKNKITTVDLNFRVPLFEQVFLAILDGGEQTLVDQTVDLLAAFKADKKIQKITQIENITTVTGTLKARIYYLDAEGKPREDTFLLLPGRSMVDDLANANAPANAAQNAGPRMLIGPGEGISRAGQALGISGIPNRSGVSGSYLSPPAPAPPQPPAEPPRMETLAQTESFKVERLTSFGSPLRLKNKDGRLIWSLSYNSNASSWWSSNGLTELSHQGKKWAVIRHNGKLVILDETGKDFFKGHPEGDNVKLKNLDRELKHGDPLPEVLAIVLPNGEETLANPEGKDLLQDFKKNSQVSKVLEVFDDLEFYTVRCKTSQGDTTIQYFLFQNGRLEPVLVAQLPENLRTRSSHFQVVESRYGRYLYDENGNYLRGIPPLNSSFRMPQAKLEELEISGRKWIAYRLGEWNTAVIFDASGKSYFAGNPAASTNVVIQGKIPKSDDEPVVVNNIETHYDQYVTRTRDLLSGLKKEFGASSLHILFQDLEKNIQLISMIGKEGTPESKTQMVFVTTERDGTVRKLTPAEVKGKKIDQLDTQHYSIFRISGVHGSFFVIFDSNGRYFDHFYLSIFGGKWSAAEISRDGKPWLVIQKQEGYWQPSHLLNLEAPQGQRVDHQTVFSEGLPKNIERVQDVSNFPAQSVVQMLENNTVVRNGKPENEQRRWETVVDGRQDLLKDYFQKSGIEQTQSLVPIAPNLYYLELAQGEKRTRVLQIAEGGVQEMDLTAPNFTHPNVMDHNGFKVVYLPFGQNYRVSLFNENGQRIREWLRVTTPPDQWDLKAALEGERGKVLTVDFNDSDIAPERVTFSGSNLIHDSIRARVSKINSVDHQQRTLHLTLTDEGQTTANDLGDRLSGFKKIHRVKKIQSLEEMPSIHLYKITYETKEGEIRTAFGAFEKVPSLKGKNEWKPAKEIFQVERDYGTQNYAAQWSYEQTLKVRIFEAEQPVPSFWIKLSGAVLSLGYLMGRWFRFRWKYRNDWLFREKVKRGLHHVGHGIISPLWGMKAMGRIYQSRRMRKGLSAQAKRVFDVLQLPPDSLTEPSVDQWIHHIASFSHWDERGEGPGAALQLQFIWAGQKDLKAELEKLHPLLEQLPAASVRRIVRRLFRIADQDGREWEILMPLGVGINILLPSRRPVDKGELEFVNHVKLDRLTTHSEAVASAEWIMNWQGRQPKTAGANTRRTVEWYPLDQNGVARHKTDSPFTLTSLFFYSPFVPDQFQQKTIDQTNFLLEAARSRKLMVEMIPVFELGNWIFDMRLEHSEDAVYRLLRFVNRDLKENGNLTRTTELVNYLNERVDGSKLGAKQDVAVADALAPRNYSLLKDIDAHLPQINPKFARTLKYIARGGDALLQVEPDQPIKLAETGRLFGPDLPVDAMQLDLLAQLPASGLLSDPNDPQGRKRGLDMNSLGAALAEFAKTNGKVIDKPEGLNLRSEARMVLVSTSGGQAARTVINQGKTGKRFIRELIQNARDIIRAARAAGQNVPNQIRVRVYLTPKEDGPQRWVISFRDPVGMLLDEVVYFYFPPNVSSKTDDEKRFFFKEQIKAVLQANDPETAAALLAEEWVGRDFRSPDVRAKLLGAISGLDAEAAAGKLVTEHWDWFKSSSAGIFGIGNYTAYHDADSLRLRTGKNGPVTEFNNVTQHDAKDNLTNIWVQGAAQYADPSGTHRGTQVDWMRVVEEEDRDDLDLDAMYVEELFAKYVGAVTDVEIVFVDQHGNIKKDVYFKDERKTLSSFAHVKIMTSKMRIARESIDELYVVDPTDAMLALCPDWLKAYVRENFLNLEFAVETSVNSKKGRRTVITRTNDGRTDLHEPDSHRPFVQAALMKMVVNRYRSGQIEVYGLPPYREFLRDPFLFMDYPVEDPQILEDAAAINEERMEVQDIAWDVYLKDAKRFRALLLNLRGQAFVNKEARQTPSLAEEKRQAFFQHAPPAVQRAYEQIPALSRHLRDSNLGNLPDPVESQDLFSRQTAVRIFQAMAEVLMEQPQRIHSLFPEIPEDYLEPEVPAIRPDAQTANDLRAIEAGEWESVNFNYYRDNPGAFSGLLVELPLAPGRTINSEKEALRLAWEQAQAKRQAAAKAPSAPERIILSGRDETYPVLQAMSAFLDQLFVALEIPAETQSGIRWRFTNGDRPVLDRLNSLVEGKPSLELLRLIVAKISAPDLTQETFFTKLLLHQGRTPDEMAVQSLGELGVRASESLGELEALVQTAGEEKKEVEFRYTRQETRSELREAPVPVPSENAVSFETRLALLRGPAAQIMEPGLRSELRLRLYETLWPRSDSKASQVSGTQSLSQSIQSSTRPITAVSWVPGLFKEDEMDAYLKGVISVTAAPGSPHQVMTMVPSSIKDAFERSMNRRLDGILDPKRYPNGSEIRSKIRVTDEEGYEKMQAILFSGREVVFIGPRTFSPLAPESARRVFRFGNDQFLDGRRISRAEQRQAFGTFVVGAFEALLLPPEQHAWIGQDPLTDIWRFRNYSGWNSRIKSMDILLRQAAVFSQAA